MKAYQNRLISILYFVEAINQVSSVGPAKLMTYTRFINPPPELSTWSPQTFASQQTAPH
jgi:hypothetical protein